MNLDEIRANFEQVGLGYLVTMDDLLKGETASFSDALSAMGDWFELMGLANGLDYALEFDDDPSENGHMQIVPVFGFQDAKTALYFKLAFR